MHHLAILTVGCDKPYLDCEHDTGFSQDKVPVRVNKCAVQVNVSVCYSIILLLFAVSLKP